MHSELKFRVWDTKEKRFMVDGFEESLYLSLNHGLVFINTVGEPMEVEKERYVIQQYTGLQDCDGKDIIEGDILEYTYNVGCFRLSNGELLRGSIPSNETIQEKINQQVKWQGPQFIGIHPIIKIGYTLVDKKPQVIGNIFENPELLKQYD